MKTLLAHAPWLSVVCLLFTGCLHTEKHVIDGVTPRAEARLDGKSGSLLEGDAVFTREGAKVKLEVKLRHAPPGTLAMHLHEVPDCSAKDGSSAGEHWNPAGVEHGMLDRTPFHLGDVGNVQVGPEGEGTFTISTDVWSIGTNAPNDVVGRTLVVHAGPDDFVSQPAGNSGDRIGCGVVRLTAPAAPLVSWK